MAIEGSYSASQSKEAGETEKEVFSANAMEDYLRKQAEKKSGGAPSTSAPAKAAGFGKRTAKDISESSDKYTDEDFESVSKSQSLPPASGAPARQTPAFGQSRITATYVKKENKFTMTDMGKYSFQGSDQGGLTGDAKAWALKRNLEDAEMLIQDMRHAEADLKEEVQRGEQKMKQGEMDCKSARREAANANATNERMKEQLKDYMHKINLYKIETEDLIKQIDLADAKTREKEDDLRLCEAEYDRKMKLQEERILMRRSKNEDRGAYELKREHQIQYDALKHKLTEKDEETDYYKTKCEKLEAENGQLRTGKGDNKKLRELENELELTKVQLREAENGGGGPSLAGASNAASVAGQDLRNVKKQLSSEEQMQLQRELQQLDLIVKGYMDENQKAMRKLRDLED